MKQNGTSKDAMRRLTVTALFAAVSTVLMLLEFPLPFLPDFLKVDLSDFPALIVSFALSPWHGALVCLLKNLLHLPFTATAGIGELNNLVIGILFVVPAGWIYRRKKTRAVAVWACLAGTMISGVLGGIVYNYFVGYPLYVKALLLPLEAILGMYRVILPSVSGLLPALLIFNVPLTVGKGLISTLITVFVYKKLSPILKGKNR